jgi:DNA modification methylase
MRRQGWLWTEEFIWHKKNCYPGKWPNRFRDSWERLLQFNKARKFSMYQDAVMVPMGDWADRRLKNLSDTDNVRDPSKVGSGFGKRVANWVGREYAYPTNVLHMATETKNKSHSAVFPDSLPEWFIKLFTEPGDMVLDPFAGSGTTLRVARKLERNSLGIEIRHEYIALSNATLEPMQARLLESRESYDVRLEE